MCMFQYGIAVTAWKDKPIPKHFKTLKILKADNVFCYWVDVYSIQNMILELTS